MMLLLCGVCRARGRIEVRNRVAIVEELGEVDGEVEGGGVVGERGVCIRDQYMWRLGRVYRIL